MLRTYLTEQDAERLTTSLRKRSAPTVFCFYGTGSNGKTTVANHLCGLLEDVQHVSEFDRHAKYLTKSRYNIVSVNDDVNKVKEWCEKNGYEFQLYHFEKVF